MTFGVFVPSFRPVFDPIGAVVTPPAGDWWEAGGAPTPLAVYQPKDAASQAASYVNLVNPGTYDAYVDTDPAPTWDASYGWTDAGQGSMSRLFTGIDPAAGWAILARFGGTNYQNQVATVGSGAYDTGFGVGSSFFGNHLWTDGATHLENAYGEVIAILSHANKSAYWNGSVVGTIGAGAPVGSNVQLIGAFNLRCTGTVIAVAIWDTSTGHATWMPAVMAAVALI